MVWGWVKSSQRSVRSGTINGDGVRCILGMAKMCTASGRWPWLPMISRWVLHPFQYKQELSSVCQFIAVLNNLWCLLSSSDDELTECLWLWWLTVCTVLCGALSTDGTWLLLATVRECSYWPRTSIKCIPLLQDFTFVWFFFAAGQCVSNCSGLADGTYQSCQGQGCNMYAQCLFGVIYNLRCDGDLVYDDSTKRCQITSQTCSTNTTQPSSEYYCLALPFYEQMAEWC